MISVVVPVYGAPNSLTKLYESLAVQLQSLSDQYEIIFVNDSCPFGSWSKIEEICRKDIRVKGINLVRNFGQHAALSCGFAHTKGDWIVVMDCDLQDDPKYIKEFCAKANEGYDVVQAKRIARKVNWIKRLQSWFFYRILGLLLDVKMEHQIANYGIYSKRVIRSISELGDRVRFFPYLVSWVGYKAATVDIVQEQRGEGTSSYTLGRSLRLALDVALSSSNRPLHWSVLLGGFCSAGSFLLGALFVIRYFTTGLAPSGWTSLSVTIFFSTGLILLNLGIVGLYLSRVYDQTKKRPIYLVESVLNE